MELVQHLTYRLSTETDLPGILKLWDNYSGWWTITQQEFTDWYINTPYGKSLIIVAEDTSGEIVGHLSLIPAVISIYGKRVKALRLSAPIVHQSFRLHDFRSMDHPAVIMILQGMAMANEMGYSMIYALPSHGWLGLLKKFSRFGLPNVQTASYECVSISLTDTAIVEHFTPSNYHIEVIEKFDDAFDVLWNEATVSFPVNCSIVRDSDWLNWKKGNHLALKITKGDELAGYAVFKKKDGLLVDILARTSTELKDILLSCIKALHGSGKTEIETDFKQVKLMRSAHLEPIIKTLPTNPVNFQFAFCCHPLNDIIHHADVHPENWYLMPLD